MAVSKSQQKAVHKYVKANYDRMELTVHKGQKDTIKAHAAALGESVNGFIGRAILEAMERDGGGTAAPGVAPAERVLAETAPTSSQQSAETAQGSGGIPVSPGTLAAAEQAAERTGEGVGDFVARAVETQAQRDKSSLRLGINPATGGKLKKEA